MHRAEGFLSIVTLTAVLAAAAVRCASGQQYETLPKLTQPSTAPASADPLSWSNFNYTAGNAAALPGPEIYSDGLSKGVVAGIVTGCILGGLVLGALAMLCFLKRRRLFPKKYGPPKHPHEAGSIHALDVLRTGTKLDNMTKEELVSPKSFAVQHHVGV